MGAIQIALAISCAVIASQFPSFEIHYENRLQARLDEAQRQVSLFEAAAKASGHSLEKYITFFEAQEAREFRENGRMMRKSLQREQSLRAAYQKITSSHYPMKVFVWLGTLDTELTKDSWAHYTPALTLNEASVVAALFGYLFSYLLSFSIRSLITRICLRTKRTDAAKGHSSSYRI